MKTRITLAGLLFLSWFSAACAETLFTRPFIVISPTNINFGELRLKQSATNSILVENIGGGTLVGKASVPPPFKILSGADYKLKRGAAQVVTIAYSPDRAPTNAQVVTFTGGSKEVRATVTGRLSTKRWPYYLKRK